MKSEKGFTLVELMVALLLASMIISAVMLAYTTGHATFFHLSFQENLMRDERLIVQNLMADVEQYGVVIVNNSPQRLELKKDSTTIIYEVQGNLLNRTENNVTVTLSDKIKSWSFGGDTQQVQIDGVLSNRLADVSIKRAFYVRTGKWDYQR